MLGHYRFFIISKSCRKAEDESKAQREKLREMKEAAEAKQSQLQKEMKEELERLRTEFVFKVCYASLLLIVN